MTKAQLQEKLQFFKKDDETYFVELYLLYEDENNNIETYIPATEENKLGPALSDIVKKSIKNKFFIESADYEYRVVNVNSSEADDVRQVYHVNMDKIPKADIIFNKAINNEAIPFPKDLELEKVWGYIFKVDSLSNGTIYLFKKNYPINVLKNENTYGLFFLNNKLSLFDKDLLRLSKHFDVMLIDKELIILNRKEFEKAFDYIKAMQSEATRNVNVIKRTNLIEDLDKIKELSKNKRTLRKLLNINPKSKILSKSPVQIAKLARKYKVIFKLTDDSNYLSITTKKAAISFVELLNDDFLKSEFSGSLYKTKGKSSID